MRKGYPELEALFSRSSEFRQTILQNLPLAAQYGFSGFFGKGFCNPLKVPQSPCEAYKRFSGIQNAILRSSYKISAKVSDKTKEQISLGTPLIFLGTHFNILGDYFAIASRVRRIHPAYTVFPVIGDNLKVNAASSLFYDAGNVIYTKRKGFDEEAYKKMSASLEKPFQGVYIASTPGISHTGQVTVDKRITYILASFTRKGIPVVPVSLMYSSFPSANYTSCKNRCLFSEGAFPRKASHDTLRLLRGLFPHGISRNILAYLSNSFSKEEISLSFSDPTTSRRLSLLHSDLMNGLLENISLLPSQRYALAKLVDAKRKRLLSHDETVFLSKMHGISLEGLASPESISLGYDSSQLQSPLSIKEVSLLALHATPAYQRLQFLQKHL